MKIIKQARRIHIFGACGSGKSFLSKKLSKILRLPVYDLDDIFWKKGKERKYDVKRDEKERARLLKKLVKKDKWIIEGCFSSWVDDSIKRSDLVVWLNPPFHLLSYRLISRFMRRKLLGDLEGWKGLWKLLKYAKNYHKKNQPAGYYKHLEQIKRHKVQCVYITNKRELNNFLKEVQKEAGK